jgi:hypothetical protein
MISNIVEENGPSNDVDYRIVGWTLEFVVTAKSDISKLINKEALTDDVIINACIFLLTRYQMDHPNLILPTHLESLFQLLLDVLKQTKYHLSDYRAAPKIVKRSGIHWSTIKKRWTGRRDPSCIPSVPPEDD